MQALGGGLAVVVPIEEAPAGRSGSISGSAGLRSLHWPAAWDSPVALGACAPVTWPWIQWGGLAWIG